MASSPPPAKKSSGWGSFLQQAVAGVESRLDTILADEDDPSPRNARTAGKAPDQPGLQPGLSASPQRGSKARTGSLSRSPSAAKANDRLQERLARAMAQKNSSARAESPASSIGTPSRVATPTLGSDNARLSFESALGQFGSPLKDTTPKIEHSRAPSPLVTEGSEIQDLPKSPQKLALEPPISFTAPPESMESSQVSSPVRGSLESTRGGASDQDKQTPDITVNGSSFLEPMDNSQYEAAMEQLKTEHEAAELRWQEELHDYVERLDALQSKLQYLTREAAESAKQAGSGAGSGSLEKKISEKDVQIALLMEEGQKLSKIELKHMTTIKKLRSQTLATEKSTADMKARAENAERDLANSQEKLKRTEAAEKRTSEKSNQLTKVERDFEALSADRNNLSIAISDLNAQLARVTARAEAAETKAQNDTSEQEGRQITELKHDITSAKVEREVSEEKLRREIRDLRESVEREKERGRIQEIELRGEQSVLESKLETMRVRAEEVSSGATGDAQAKLLRQIETLQTQYSVASENWQGIEGSLLSRLANVEKERDDIAKREGDLRRKTREATVKEKKAEADLDFSNSRVDELERSLATQHEDLKKMRLRLQQSQQETVSVKQDLSHRQEAWEANLSARIEEEKSKWAQQGPQSPYHLTRLDSPSASLRKPSDFGLLSIVPNRHNDPMGSISDRPPSRRPSFQPGHPFFSERSTPPRQSSSHSLTQLPMNGMGNNMAPPDTPSIHTVDTSDDFFADTPATPASQGTHRGSLAGIHDILSHATVAAGPSVQLVERLSQTVRRLESERSASKDELTRLTAQRDEARQEVVELMREVETKRAGDERIEKLEREVKELDSRYQASLEMLGEKSETVEELKADVGDLKRILRETMDSMMR